LKQIFAVLKKVFLPVTLIVTVTVTVTVTVFQLVLQEGFPSICHQQQKSMPNIYIYVVSVCRPVDTGSGAFSGSELVGYMVTLVSDNMSASVLVNSSSTTSLSISVQWSADGQSAHLLVPEHKNVTVSMPV
jgi:hypothetical protein